MRFLFPFLLFLSSFLCLKNSMGIYKKNSYKSQPSEPSQDYWIDQILDHFDPMNHQTTFKQRFWMNDTFADGKSLLFAFGGVKDNILAEIARENKMMLIYIEHRFYGSSVPNNDSSNGNLKYLTTEQALHDYVYFLQWAKSEHGIPKLRHLKKVITFGCSYSGMLSAFFRQKFSWLTVGAIAGSAPVLAQLNFPEYDVTVSKVLSSKNPLCEKIVREAFQELIQKDVPSLQRIFNTCPQNLTVRMVDITSAVGGLVQGAVQGNNPDAGFPVNALCNTVVNSNSSSSFDALLEYVQSQQAGACLDVNSVGDILVPGASRSWTWQTCIEYGFFQTDDSSKIFGGKMNLQFFIDICKVAFPRPYGPHRANVNYTNYLFGGLDQNQASWIIFSNGLQDPWGSNLGINKALGPTLPVTLSTSAHCAPYHKPNKDDPQDLIQSRLDIKKFVRDALARKF